jgi:hypothetical protein
MSDVYLGYLEQTSQQCGLSSPICSAQNDATTLCEVLHLLWGGTGARVMMLRQLIPGRSAMSGSGRTIARGEYE